MKPLSIMRFLKKEGIAGDIDHGFKQLTDNGSDNGFGLFCLKNC